MEDFEPYFFFL